jgi:long-chain acyl-CoA synthetase
VDIPVTYQDGRRSQFTAQVFIRDVTAADQTTKAGISNGRR